MDEFEEYELEVEREANAAFHAAGLGGLRGRLAEDASDEGSES